MFPAAIGRSVARGVNEYGALSGVGEVPGWRPLSVWFQSKPTRLVLTAGKHHRRSFFFFCALGGGGGGGGGKKLCLVRPSSLGGACVWMYRISWARDASRQRCPSHSDRKSCKTGIGTKGRRGSSLAGSTLPPAGIANFSRLRAQQRAANRRGDGGCHAEPDRFPTTAALLFFDSCPCSSPPFSNSARPPNAS